MSADDAISLIQELQQALSSLSVLELLERYLITQEAVQQSKGNDIYKAKGMDKTWADLWATEKLQLPPWIAA